jgi:hypothetical protein
MERGQMKKGILLASVVAMTVVAVSAWAQTITIASWTFETSVPTTAGPYSPEVGAGSASGSGLNVYSSPAGNGSAHSYSANGWATASPTTNSYWQFQVSTLTLSNITVTYDQNGSGTGPRDFVFQYSTDGTSFTQVDGPYSLTSGITWSTTGSPQGTHVSPATSSIAALTNQSTVYLRIVDNSTVNINGGAVGASGTDRVDNFVVTGIPEPSTVLLVGAGLVGLLAIRRRRS